MISLIGLPGSGKSTVGCQLARRLHLPFFDSDRIIEEQLGCSVREYFELMGEERFRDHEACVMDELTQKPAGVLSTGGGVVMRLVNRKSLRERTRVIYLNSLPEELIRRLRHDKNRPLLQVADPLERLRDLHALRHPLYLETAHFTVNIGPQAKLMTSILAHLEH